MPGRDALAAVILAAGEGTRMKSATPKILHPIAGLPMIAYPVRLAARLAAEPIVLVVGRGADDVLAAARAAAPEARLRPAEQTQRLGTAHAVLAGLARLKRFRGRVLILYGDVPNLHLGTVRKMVTRARRRAEPLVLLTCQVPDPFGYGRILRDADGQPLRIVEEKDATPAERTIEEINVGTYLVEADLLRQALARVGDRNAKREFYLTDLVEVVRAAGGAVGAVQARDPGEVAGVNDRLQLAQAEVRAQDALLVKLMRGAVTLADPATVHLDVDVKVGRDSWLGRGGVLQGATRVGPGCRSEAHAVRADTRVGRGACIGAGSVLEGAVVAAGAQVPPLTHVPPGRGRVR